MKRGLEPSSVFGLADNPARAVPAVDRAILKVAEHARRLPRGGTETLRLGKLIDSMQEHISLEYTIGQRLLCSLQTAY
jgi:hypothetical protein